MASTKEIENDFKRLIKNEALTHGYIFFGHAIEQQFKAAKSLANFLETGKWAEPARVLFDARFIDGAREDLGIEDMREFTHSLYQQPVVSSRRTLVVNAAHELTSQAENALLKISEEPPAHALIILIVADVNVLAPTLQSRFQKVFFSPIKGEKIARSELEKEAVKLVEKFLMSDPRARSQLIKALVERDRDTDEKGEKIFDYFVRFLIEELAKKPEQNWRALKHLLNRYTLINQYQTNKRLQLEAVLPFLE